MHITNRSTLILGIVCISPLFAHGILHQDTDDVRLEIQTELSVFEAVYFSHEESLEAGAASSNAGNALRSPNSRRAFAQQASSPNPRSTSSTRFEYPAFLASEHPLRPGLAHFGPEETASGTRQAGAAGRINPNVLDDTDRLSLMALLAGSPSDTDEPETIHRLSVKNDVLDSLLRCSPLPDDLGALMLAIVADVEQDPVWREYVLQHFEILYGRISSETESGPQELRLNIQRTLARALFDDDAGLAGTALIVVEELVGAHAEFSPTLVQRAARRLASSESAGLATRISALAMLESESASEGVSIAERLASDSSLHPTLRLAARGRLARWASIDPDARRAVERVDTKVRRNPQDRVFLELSAGNPRFRED